MGVQRHLSGTIGAISGLAAPVSHFNSLRGDRMKSSIRQASPGMGQIEEMLGQEEGLKMALG
jgi:hypothetical protein